MCSRIYCILEKSVRVLATLAEFDDTFLTNDDSNNNKKNSQKMSSFNIWLSFLFKRSVTFNMFVRLQ
jgi:hypothetical protein